VVELDSSPRPVDVFGKRADSFRAGRGARDWNDNFCVRVNEIVAA
jgi:hypothetical protein